MYFYKLKLIRPKIFFWKKFCLIFNEFIPCFCYSLYIKLTPATPSTSRSKSLIEKVGVKLSPRQKLIASKLEKEKREH
jgi:hypothetical protein